jgi:Protein of unknown function (DUF1097)
MSRNAFATNAKVILGESVVASSAATISVMLLDVPVWAMFVGWISFFTRGLTLRQGLINFACLLMGVTLGIGAAHALSALSPHLGPYALTAVVFAITVVALSLAKAPVFNNLLCIFLGLVAYFAFHQPPAFSTFAQLALAAAVGVTAAFLAHSLQKTLQRRAAA